MYWARHHGAIGLTLKLNAHVPAFAVAFSGSQNPRLTIIKTLKKAGKKKFNLIRRE